jgi:ribosome-binding ATPase
VDPIRDKEIIDIELQLKDLESVEARISKVQRAAKAGDKEASKQYDLLERIKTALEQGKSARTVQLVTADDEEFMKELQLITSKPVMYVCNVEEASVVNGNAHVERVREAVKSENAEVLVIGAAIEADIASLETFEERQMFLQDLGLDEPGVAKLIKAAYRLLNLQTYFTAGVKEVRAWTIHKGDTAPQAAGVIHSDFEKGFIRAEVIRFNDYITYKSEAAIKEAGKMGVEGKEYVVQDGDVMHFRFNV